MKHCFRSLAQYKDAFLSANPTFKWYKLPAPPLRTLPTQVSKSNGSERSDSFSDPYDFDIEPLPRKRSTSEAKPIMGGFKLADEAQMGGLSSLMKAAEVINGKMSPEKPLVGDHHKDPNQRKCHSSRLRSVLLTAVPSADGFDQFELHNELAKTRSFMEKTMNGLGATDDAFSAVPYQANGHFEQTYANIPTKAYYKQHSPDKSFEFDFYDDEGSSGDNSSSAAKKSPRACKGKRYLEFMNAQKAHPSATRKSKQRTTSSSSSSASLSPVEVALGSANARPASARKIDCHPYDHPAHASEIALRKPKTEPSGKCSDATGDTNNKFFDASDFDLEEKIKALPGRNLDKYLSRKRDTKKKKRVSGRRSNFTVRKSGTSKGRQSAEKKKAAEVQPPRTIEEAKERLMMVGSQKRKARKESITRRDVLSLITMTESVLVPTTDNNIEATGCAPNLLFLATIAEANASLGV